ncbi:MAG: hypothetical protein ACOYIG_02040 [Acetivibrionales bacterium]|jgi:hypothetical protein|nr:rhomboid family intramembrane serine protease [Clostridiaceae bacterium]
MKRLSRLELRYGRYAISNLTLYIAALNLAVFLLSVFSRGYGIVGLLTLNPNRIIKNLEIWRLITFVFIPETFSIFWILFSVYLIYMLGESLERYWGTFKLNVYYFVGMLGSIIAAFITYIFAKTGAMTGYYLNMSLFLAYATLFPEQEFMIFFILPVKVKYLGMLDAAFLLYSIYFSISIGAWYQAVAILVAIINYLLFFGKDFIKWIKLRRQVAKNRKRFFDQVRPYNDRYRKY